MSEPFEETETESSLRRIAEASRALREAKEADAKASLALAEAKDERKKTASLVALLRYELEESAAGETKDYPLFPRPAGPAAASVAGAPSPADPGPPGDASRFVLALVPGLPSAVVDGLSKRGIHTLGDLAAFTNGGGTLGDVKGVGPETAERALAALAEFWRQRGAA